MFYPNESIEDLETFVKNLKERNFRIFFLSGKMGSGKTTFVRKYCEGYNISSPTYTICNQVSDGIFHFDLYMCSNIPLELPVALLDKQVFIEWWEKWPLCQYEKYLCEKDYCFITMGKKIQLLF